MIYEDPDVLVFLNPYPTLRGYTLVCPRRHVERVVRDFTKADQQLAALPMSRGILRIGVQEARELADQIRERPYPRTATMMVLALRSRWLRSMLAWDIRVSAIS